MNCSRCGRPLVIKNPESYTVDRPICGDCLIKKIEELKARSLEGCTATITRECLPTVEW